MHTFLFCANVIAIALSLTPSFSSAQISLDLRNFSPPPPSISVRGDNNTILNNSSVNADMPRQLETEKSAEQEASNSRLRVMLLRPPTTDLDRDTQLEDIRRIETGSSGVSKDVSLAFRRYVAAGKRGDASAYVEAGRMLVDIGTPRAIVEANEYFGMAAKKGIADAYAWQAWLHDSKQLINFSHSLAFDLYQKSAALGGAWAAYKLGVIYQRGALGKTRNDGLSIDWFSKAAERYYVPAILEMAWMLEYGSDSIRNVPRALEMLQMAARFGDKNAIFLLGLKYRTGDGVPSDAVIASEYFDQAARLGEPRAQNELAAIALNDKSPGKDLSNGLVWLRKAAAQNLPMAMSNLGFAYETGSGVISDKVAALQWYERASNAGDPRGRASLGSMLRHGYGAPKNIDRAIQLLKSAVELGSREAAYALGDIYSDVNARQDWLEAEKWLRVAAEQDIAVAQNDLSVFIFQGHITARDPDEATRLMKRASDAKFPLAVVNYARRLSSGIGVMKNVDAAIEILIPIAKTGYVAAEKELVALYIQRGSPSDIVTAVSMATDLARADDDALEQLGRILTSYPAQASAKSLEVLVPRLQALARASNSTKQDTALLFLANAAIQKRWDVTESQLPLRQLHQVSERRNGEIAAFLWMLYLQKNRDNLQLITSPAFRALIQRAAESSGFMQKFSSLFLEIYTVLDAKSETEGTQRMQALIESMGRRDDFVSTLLSDALAKKANTAPSLTILREFAAKGDLMAKQQLCAALASFSAIPLTSQELADCE